MKQNERNTETIQTPETQAKTFSLPEISSDAEREISPRCGQKRTRGFRPLSRCCPGKRLSQSYIPTALRRALVDDFVNGCAYCGSPKRLLDGGYRMDHILPESAGGLTERENLCWSRLLCNLYKSARTSARESDSRRRVPLYHPRRQKWTRHFDWSPDGLLIVGKTRCGRATIAAVQLNNPSLVRMRSLWMRLGARPPDWKLDETEEDSSSSAK